MGRGGGGRGAEEILGVREQGPLNQTGGEGRGETDGALRGKGWSRECVCVLHIHGRCCVCTPTSPAIFSLFLL